MDAQQLVHRAWELKKAGELAEALACYDKAYNAIVGDAVSYAHSKGGVVDEGSARKILPKNFTLVKEYLKQGKDVATILNNMGVICAELGQYGKAKGFFEEAIELTPENVDYPHPKTNLMNIK